MSTIRTTLRQTLALGATAGVAALAMSFADPADAACRGHGCSSGHHSGPAPSSRRVTQVPTTSGQPKKKSYPVMAQVPPLTVNPGGQRRQQGVQPVSYTPTSGGGGMVVSPYRRSGPVGGSSDQAPGGSSGYTSANGPGPAPKAGDTTKPTVPPDANIAAARICVLPAGSWCSIAQGDVGTKCRCPDNNSGRASEGIVK
jgi:hypothetical protein